MTSPLSSFSSFFFSLINYSAPTFKIGKVLHKLKFGSLRCRFAKRTSRLYPFQF